MKILSESQFNQMIQNRNRNDGTSFDKSIGDLPIADYVMTVEIIESWSAQDGGGYAAKAKRVAFDDGNFSLVGEEFPIWNPMSTGMPDNAVGDRMAVCYRGRWEIIGGGGGGGRDRIVADELIETMVYAFPANTRDGYRVESRTMIQGRAISANTPIIHNGNLLLDFAYYSQLLPISPPLISGGTLISQDTSGGLFNLTTAYRLYSPKNTQTTTNLSLPITISALPITYPAWVWFSFIPNYDSGILESPFTSSFVRGSLSNSNLVTSSPTNVNPIPFDTDISLSISWISSIPTSYRNTYSIQYRFVSSLQPNPVWVDDESSVSTKLVKFSNAQNNMELQSRIAVKNPVTGEVWFTEVVSHGIYTGI